MGAAWHGTVHGAKGRCFHGSMAELLAVFLQGDVQPPWMGGHQQDGRERKSWLLPPGAQKMGRRSCNTFHQF